MKNQAKTNSHSAHLLEQFASCSSEGMWHFGFVEPVDTSLPVEEQIESMFGDATLRYCNQQYADMYGQTLEQLIGQPLLYLFDRDENNLRFAREFIRAGYQLTGAISNERDRCGKARSFVNNLVGVLDSKGGKQYLVEVFGTQSEYRPSHLHSPVFGEPTPSDKWPQLFVVMPFATDLKPIFDDHIKTIADKLDISAARADDFFRVGSIVSDIWSAINYARVILADCTGRNPNVFYEIGMAHTLGKDTVLIAQSIDDVPFDLRHLRVITYEYTPPGMNKFEDELLLTLNSVFDKSTPTTDA